jgi:hypothetical protein
VSFKLPFLFSFNPESFRDKRQAQAFAPPSPGFEKSSNSLPIVFKRFFFLSRLEYDNMCV